MLGVSAIALFSLQLAWASVELDRWPKGAWDGGEVVLLGGCGHFRDREAVLPLIGPASRMENLGCGSGRGLYWKFETLGIVPYRGYRQFPATRLATGNRAAVQQCSSASPFGRYF